MLCFLSVINRGAIPSCRSILGAQDEQHGAFWYICFDIFSDFQHVHTQWDFQSWPRQVYFRSRRLLCSSHFTHYDELLIITEAPLIFTAIFLPRASLIIIYMMEEAVIGCFIHFLIFTFHWTLLGTRVFRLIADDIKISHKCHFYTHTMIYFLWSREEDRLSIFYTCSRGPSSSSTGLAPFRKLMATGHTSDAFR